jgi:predicted pyridoxine 5'-phosphate oxidase superfamily flavin-nucleotide-binding protein
MGIQLAKEVIELLADQETVKILATTDQDGEPHAVIKQTLHLGEDGNLVILELLESSHTSKNLLRSIWFQRRVAVTLWGKNGENYQIKGKPVRNIITGPVFQKHYTAIRERLGDTDLAGIWIIEPEEVVEETYRVRRAAEEAAHPYFTHLDRLAKSNSI